MKRLATVALALVGVMAISGVAFGENRYDVEGSSATPHGKGSPTKPLPLKVKRELTFRDSNPENRPVTALTKYWIGTEGVVAFQNAFPKCTFTEANAGTLALAESKCGKAKIAQGVLEAVTGPSTNKLMTASVPCNAKVTVYNLGSGAIAPRIDTDPPIPALGSGDIGCALPTHAALRAKFITKTIGGMKSTAYQIELPENLRHAAGLDAALLHAVDNYRLLTTKAKVKGARGKVKVGFFSAIGCKGSTRTTQARVWEEGGKSVSATTTSKC